MDEFKALNELEDIISGVLTHLSPAGKTKLMRRVAREWRKGQADRIKKQKNPDGSSYEARKPRAPRRLKSSGTAPLKAKKPSKRELAMFKKLRSTRYLKAGANDREAWVGFMGGHDAKIAEIHQFGLKDRAAPNAPEVKYAMRELLGTNDDDREALLDLVIEELDTGMY